MLLPVGLLLVAGAVAVAVGNSVVAENRATVGFVVTGRGDGERCTCRIQSV